MFWFFRKNRDEEAKLRIMLAEMMKQRLEIQQAQATAEASMIASQQCLTAADIDAHVQYRIGQALKNLPVVSIEKPDPDLSEEVKGDVLKPTSSEEVKGDVPTSSEEVKGDVPTSSEEVKGDVPTSSEETKVAANIA